MKKVNHTSTWEAEVNNSVNYYIDLFANAPVVLSEEGPFVSPDKFNSHFPRDFHGRDNNHYPMHPHYLKVGLLGIAAEAEMSALQCEGENHLLLTSVAKVYRTAAEYMARYADAAEKACSLACEISEKNRLAEIADICRALSVRAPETFIEACELFLFCWRIRSHNHMATIGRLDQYLIDFYRRDTEAGILTEDKALTLIVALWNRINTYGSGDTLTNVMLGGVDKDGNDATNELSYLMLRASIIKKSTEPQICCRIHKNTPDKFFELMVELQALGHGQASLYNDEVIIPNLMEYGYSLEDARNYSSDGCSEIIIDANSTIDFFQMEAVKAMELTIFEGKENPVKSLPVGHYWTKSMAARPVISSAFLGYAPWKMSEINSYEEFYSAYLDEYRFQLMGMMEAHNEKIHNLNRSQIPSLFLLGSFPSFLKNGVDIHYSEDICQVHDIFFGSVPTVADCLAAVKKVVFEDKLCTLVELREALQADFEGYDTLRTQLLAAPKVGNDDDYADSVLSRLFDDIMLMFDELNDASDMKYLPCFYNYLFNDFAKTVGATPDGRRRGEPICEHFSPTPGRAKNGPTAVLRSLTKSNIGRGAGASTVNLSLSRDILTGDDDGKRIISALMRSAVAMKVQILNLAIYDSAVLRAAQENPESYEDIIVRVWGYSARFVDLSRDMQEHVIARIVKEGQ